MKLFLHYSPFWLKWIYPDYIWRINTTEKKIFLTFDDGPIPDITEQVLETLEAYNARATFFCIGDNVRKHPSVFRKLMTGGHSIGNHTFNHLNGWKTDPVLYHENYLQGQNILASDTSLFRPPYGRIRKQQVQLLPAETQIVMWDVLTGDYSPEISKERCLRESVRHARNGSIVLFHDSIKAQRNMEYTLPRFLQEFAGRGYQFEALPMSGIRYS